MAPIFAVDAVYSFMAFFLVIGWCYLILKLLSNLFKSAVSQKASMNYLRDAPPLDWYRNAYLEKQILVELTDDEFGIAEDLPKSEFFAGLMYNGDEVGLGRKKVWAKVGNGGVTLLGSIQFVDRHDEWDGIGLWEAPNGYQITPPMFVLSRWALNDKLDEESGCIVIKGK